MPGGLGVWEFHRGPEGIIAALSSNVFCKEFLFRNPQFEIRNRSPSPFGNSQINVNDLSGPERW